MEGETKAVHTLELEGRGRARLAGVMAVSCFNEQEIVLETSEGEVALLGEGMYIERLNLEDGRLDVTGQIAGIEYNGPVGRKSAWGLFGRKRK